MEQRGCRDGLCKQSPVSVPYQIKSSFSCFNGDLLLPEMRQTRVVLIVPLWEQMEERKNCCMTATGRGVRTHERSSLHPPRSVQNEGRRCFRCRAEAPAAQEKPMMEQAVPLQPMGTLQSRSLPAAVEGPQCSRLSGNAAAHERPVLKQCLKCSPVVWSCVGVLFGELQLVRSPCGINWERDGIPWEGPLWSRESHHKGAVKTRHYELATAPYFASLFC